MDRKTLIEMVIAMAVVLGLFFAVQTWILPSDDDKPVSDEQPLPKEGEPETPSISDASPGTRSKSTPTEAQKALGFDPITRREANTWTLANENLTAVFSERGGVLDTLSFVDKDGNTRFYHTPDDPTEAPSRPLTLIQPSEAAPDLAALALKLDENDVLRNTSRWSCEGVAREEGGVTALTFRFPPAGRESDGTVIYKTFRLLPNTFRFEILVRFENHGGKPADKAVGLWGPPGITNDDQKDSAEYSRVALYAGTESRRWNDLEEAPAVASLPGELEDLNEDRADDDLPPASMLESVGLDGLDDDERTDRFLLAHGLKTKFFLAVLAADPMKRDSAWAGHVLPLGKSSAAVTLMAPALEVPAAREGKPGEAEVHMSFYAGPRDKETLEAAWAAALPADAEMPAYWREMAPSGSPALISAPLTWVLVRLGEWLGPGLAIIVLTLLVRLVMSPLSYRGQKNMAVYTEKMKVIKPKLDRVKAKFEGKKDRDSQLAMLTETRAVMREAGVGMLPIGGCLPVMLQMPIFIGLYATFRNSFFLRQASFLWIHDLTLPDATIPFSTAADFGAIPLIGSMLGGALSHNGIFTVNLLPILWIALSLIQMKMQPKADDPQQAAMQKQMGCIFPIMGLFFYSFASGFALYFIFSSLYSLAESKLIKHRLRKQGIIKPKDKTPAKADDKPTFRGAS